MLTQNGKMKKTSEINGARIFNFSLPAQKTCPWADKCKAYCYASKGFYKFSGPAKAHERNWEASKSDDFAVMMIEEIIEREATHIRIHDSGDFYNREYVAKWFVIMEALPHVIFYAYSKSLPLFESVMLPHNFTLIKSMGGKRDDMIDMNKDRHSFIFDVDDALRYQQRQYVDASHDDLKAIGENKNIGLVFH